MSFHFAHKCLLVWRIAKREVGVFKRRPLLIFCMLVAPLFATLFFCTMMYSGLPERLPTGLVDEDDSQTTRSIVRILSTMKTTGLSHRYASFAEARQAMQRGEIYAFFYIPRGTTSEALASRQPMISFYTNDSYFVAGSLLMKDLKVISEMSGIAINKAILQAKGISDARALGILQPIVIETHPMGNPCLNYGVLLNNLILPGIVLMLVMLTTAYALGIEWKLGTQAFLLNHLAQGSVSVALAGKLLPQTALYATVLATIQVFFYRIMGYPCQCNLLVMMGLGLLAILAAQGLGTAIFALFAGQMRMAMSGAALLGVLSIPMAGFSFPTTAMTPLMQALSWVFPLRDYFLVYANQALNGYALVYAWRPIVALLLLVALPLPLLPRLKRAFCSVEYKP